MKICRIVSAYSPYSFGGADIYAEKISREIVKRGNPTVIITINPNRDDSYEEDAGTKIYRFHPFNISTVHRIGKQPFFYQGLWTLLDIYSYYSYYKIKQILKNERPDIVHLHTPLDFTLSVIQAVKSLQIPLVYTLHDFFLLCRRCILLHGSGELCTDKNIRIICKVYRELTKRIVEGADLIIAPSQFVLDMHKKYGFFKETKTIVLPHGIELNQEMNRDEKEEIDILYVGGMMKHKGADILIKAFKLIKSEKIKLHLVGGGICEQELKSLAEDDRRIIFYGKMSHESVQDFYKKADVVVFPSLCYETRGNVIVEAFRAGLPVVASDIGGIPELVKDNYNGFLFKPGDEKHLKKVLENIIEKPQNLRTLKRNAKESVKQFEMSKYIDRLTEVYREVLFGRDHS